MPIYEYRCDDCDLTFEVLRRKRQADDAITCKRCDSSSTSRAISLFAAQSNGRALAGNGGGCAGCTSTGGCSTCRSH